MSPTYIATLSEVMATLVAGEPGEQLRVEHALEESLGLVTAKLAETVEPGKYSIKEFLGRGIGHTKTLGILGMNQLGEALARLAHLGFGMEILYHSEHPVPELETACDARFFGLDNVLRQANLVCVVLPLPAEEEKLMREYQGTPEGSQTILIVWQSSPPIERAIAHLNQHYAERIILDDLATIAGLSKFHFLRLFSSTLGITPHRYQLLLRVSHAKAMLRRGDKIGEVAFRVGFFDQSHLNRYFRLLVGTTPGQYQKGGAV